MSKTNFQRVKDFHKKYLGHKTPTFPVLPAPEVSLHRVRLMCEELAEVTEALSKKNLVNLAQELADLLYVVYGTADVCGINVDKVFEEVHFSNMTKSTERDSGGKVMKGADFKPANVERTLRHASNT